MPYEIYVISNSGLFREALNAVSAFCQSDDFKQFIYMGGVIGIVITAVAYVKQHDVMLFLKWLATYFIVFNVLLGFPQTVAIINTSDQTVPPLVVDNLPIGIALPASLITSMGYAITADFEKDFALPGNTTYSTTGMLFGSNLFRLSLMSQIDDPSLMNEMNNYTRSCVVGDILINHKYTFNDLLKSNNVWATMTSAPSNIRGMFITQNNKRSFVTCKGAAAIIGAKLNTYASNMAPKILAKFIPTSNIYPAAAVQNILQSSYQYFKAQSDSATQILRQNLAINAFRAGIKNYTSEAGSVAAMQNIANTTAMTNTRMSWSTSRHIGVHTLPLMQVVLLMMFLCIFPVVVVLALIPNMGLAVIKNYIFSLIWLESWPILFAILNLAMNFYLKNSTGAPVTLSSINQLAQEHSDVAGMAGYLILAIPFLSLGIVKGMAYTFNNAAQYLGGMMHSAAQSAATSAVTGNYSYGNVSMNNATSNMLSANKHDSNFSSLHGLNTQQLGNAAIMTSTASSGAVYSVAAGMSMLATSANAAHSTASSLSHQVDSSLSSALNHSAQYSDAKAHHESMGQSYTTGVSSNVDQAMHTIRSETEAYAHHHGVSTDDAFRRLSEASFSLSGSERMSEGGVAFGNGAEASQGGSESVGGSSSSTHSGSAADSNSHDNSTSDVRNFSHALNVVQNYAKNESNTNQHSDTQNAAMQMGADLNKAHRLSENAQYIESNSQAINTNFNQAFASYVSSHYPESAQSILSATGDSPLLAKQEQLAEEFVETHAHQLVQQYKQHSSQLSQHTPSSQHMVDNFQHNSKAVQHHGQQIGINSAATRHFDQSVGKDINHDQGRSDQRVSNENKTVNHIENTSQDKIRKGEVYAKEGLIEHLVTSIENEF